jgi:dihydrofolate reductase
VVVSTTFDPAEHAEITVVKSGVPDAVRALKAEAGKNIWLFGGGILFRYLLDIGLVDAIEVCVFPVLLCAGTPLLPEGNRVALKLKECKALPSGVVMVSYDVAKAEADAESRG